MPRARLDLAALRLARVPIDAPLCLLPSAWDGEIELADEEPDTPDFVAPGLAYVEVVGPLSDEPDKLCGWYDGYGGETGIAARFERALAAPAALAVLVRFKSPGGTSAGIDLAIERIVRAREQYGKPVVGWVELAASAGYWLAAQMCDELLGAGPTGQAGSIGSYVPHESMAAMLAQLGIEVTLIADPPGKVAGNPYQALDDVGRARIERDVKACTARFFAAVEDGRGLTPEALRALDGDVLSGGAAVAAGLLDGLSDLDTAMAYALGLATERAPAAAEEA